MSHKINPAVALLAMLLVIATSASSQTQSQTRTINLGRPYTYRAGNMDNSAAPSDPALPSTALKAATPGAIFKNFDDPTINRFVGHTFTSLPANIVKAELEVRMKPGGSGSFNDTINLAFMPANPVVAWGIRMGDLPLTSWNRGDAAKTFIFDLSNLPPSGSLLTDQLANLAAKRYLDVVIQDDTTVDYIKLRIWTSPPRRFSFGLPIDLLGQAKLIQAPSGFVLSGIGSNGEDGLRVDVGGAGGWDAEWLDIDKTTLPEGAFLKTTLTGEVDGIPNAPIGSMRVVKLADTVELHTSFAQLGATTLRYDFFHAGQLIDTLTGQPGDQPLTMITGRSNVTRDVHYTTLGSGTPCTTPGYPCIGAGYTFNTFDSGVLRVNGRDILVDDIRAYPENPTVSVVKGNLNVGLTLSNIPNLTITSQAVNVFGFSHQALGSAALEPFPGGLSVTNLGPDGEDGVKINLRKADTFNLSLDPIDLRGVASADAFLQAEAFGSRNGAPNQSLGKVKVTKTGADYLFTADYSAIGSTTQHIQLFNNNMLVLDLPGHSGPVGTASSWPRRLGRLGGQVETFTSDFDTGTTFLIDGRTYQGTQLRVLAEGASGVIDFKSALSLKAAGLDEFTLSGAQIGVCPAINITPATIPAGTAGTPYPTMQFSATGGCTGSFTLSVAGGALPPGLTLSAAGVLSGKATQPGTYDFTVTATDSCGCSQIQTYTLTANVRKWEFSFTRGMNEFCVWGGGGSYSSPTQIDNPYAGTVNNAFRPSNNGGVRFGTFGLCYGRILSANDRFAFKYTFNAIPVAVLSYPDINRDLGIPVPGSETRRNVFGTGLSPIGLQLYFRPQSRIKPFVNTSGGFILFKDPVPQLNGSRFNFTYDFGGGVQVFRDSRRAFTFGYKYQHISSGGRALNNSGFNGHVFYFGYSIFKAPKIAESRTWK
jgi:hypothetical protein